MNITQEILSDIVVYNKYAKYLPTKQRRETWEELVTRNKEMHQSKFPQLKEDIEDVYKMVYDKKVLPSMRSLQFAGKPIDINNSRIFNCSFLPIDDWRSFSEVMFLLLSGCGVGYSVQNHHIDKLPEIRIPKKTRRFLVGDSIEGWADSVKVLLKSYFGITAARPIFDFRDIRPKGAELITVGGKAPGPEPLKECLFQIQKVLDRKEDGSQLTSIEAHDIICRIADAVLSGGIRRAALISLFDLHDNEMLTSKHGAWWELNPQRGRANNSAVVIRSKVRKKDFFTLWEKIVASNSGEPGIYFSDDKDWGTNPCCEIALRPYQFCNLTEINVSNVESQEDLNKRVAAGALPPTVINSAPFGLISRKSKTGLAAVIPK
jgi:ribonucleoside-diphosphate reductase alpha chain